MKTRLLATSLVIAAASVWSCNAVKADALTGFSDITVVGDAIVSLRYAGTEYVVANDDLMLGTTTRWYIPADTGVPTLWAEGEAVPEATTPNGAPPKAGDPGSEGDNFLFRSGGANNMSSIDGINFQETIFPTVTDTVFVFERGGNDTGTYEAIFADGSLGAPVAFTAANVYADTGIDVAGQHAFGVVFTTDVPVQGVRITAPGHDCLSISAIPVPFDPKQSHAPQPQDGATDVPRDVVLSWTPGEEAAAVNGHVLYFSDRLDDVNDGIGGVTLSADSCDPGPLDLDTTYYWRVDEVGPGATVVAGEVWSFTVEPFVYPLPNVTATASSAQPQMGPENTVNGSGLNADDQHSTELKDMWLSTGAQPNWIQYEFDTVYKLHELWVWNSNQLIEEIVGFGAEDVTIEYSVDGSAWTVLADVPPFEQADASDDYLANTRIDFGGVSARYVKLTINTTYGDIAQCSLSEVRFFYIPVQARGPVPADGATGVDLDAALSWRPGREAASHTVYFGTDADAVTDGTAPATTVADHRLSPETLQYGLTYYWRVDEVNEAMVPPVYEGPVWSFATQQYGVVDDFESYTDDYENFNRIFQVWIDGAGYELPEPGHPGNGSGSLVGTSAPPWVERSIVHGGAQSMPFFFDNTAVAYSETERVFAAAQDWTRAGATALAVHLYGDPGNIAGQLYVKINGVKVPYDDDPVALTTAAWSRWDVELASVTTNLQRVTSLAIGIDGGGSGLLYIDDVWLLPASSSLPPTMTVAPAAGVETTGDDGAVLSVNGIAVDDLVLGTTVADFEKWADHPAADADDLGLGTYASLDEASEITVTFAVPVTTVFIIERGANDQGRLQALDASGRPIGGIQVFAQSDWFKPGVSINGQDAGAMVITSDVPIFGLMILPPIDGVTGIDPASISAVPAP